MPWGKPQGGCDSVRNSHVSPCLKTRILGPSSQWRDNLRRSGQVPWLRPFPAAPDKDRTRGNLCSLSQKGKSGQPSMIIYCSLSHHSLMFFTRVVSSIPSVSKTFSSTSSVGLPSLRSIFVMVLMLTSDKSASCLCETFRYFLLALICVPIVLTSQHIVNFRKSSIYSGEKQDKITTYCDYCAP